MLFLACRGSRRKGGPGSNGVQSESEGRWGVENQTGTLEHRKPILQIIRKIFCSRNLIIRKIFCSRIILLSFTSIVLFFLRPLCSFQIFYFTNNNMGGDVGRQIGRRLRLREDRLGPGYEVVYEHEVESQ